MDWNAIVQRAWPMITNLVIVVFTSLGFVYMFGRLLFPKLKDRGKNVIAFVSLIIVSYSMTLVWTYYPDIFGEGSPSLHVIFKYLLESFGYAAIGSVFYVTIGWRFYPRMNALLDLKFGKGNRRKK